MERGGAEDWKYMVSRTVFFLLVLLHYLTNERKCGILNISLMLIVLPEDLGAR